VRHAPKFKLTSGHIINLKSLMKNTTNKREYRRVMAILQKSEGRSYEDIAKEHGVNIRSAQRWIAAYIFTME
jgi:hypothetical protein